MSYLSGFARLSTCYGTTKEKQKRRCNIYFGIKSEAQHCQCRQIRQAQVLIAINRFYVKPQSAYEMKNKLSSFKRPFKMKKDGVFLFLIFLLVPKIFTILYYAN